MKSTLPMLSSSNMHLYPATGLHKSVLYFLCLSLVFREWAPKREPHSIQKMSPVWHHKGHWFLFQVYDNSVGQLFVLPSDITSQLFLFKRKKTKQHGGEFCVFAEGCKQVAKFSFLEQDLTKKAGALERNQMHLRGSLIPNVFLCRLQATQQNVPRLKRETCTSLPQMDVYLKGAHVMYGMMRVHNRGQEWYHSADSSAPLIGN